jgi:hypothetical protein
MSSRLTRRIVKMLEEYGQTWPGGTENAKIQRTHAGHWQRSSGAWSWYLRPVDLDNNDGHAFPDVGSIWPATEIANPKAEVSIHVDTWGAYEFFVKQEPFPPV